MVKLEIEIVTGDSKEYLFELRNYLNERIDNLQVSIKEQPALEGAMSPFSSEGILNGVIHAGVGIGIEQCVHVLLPVLKDFFKNIPLPFGKKVEILATLGDDTGRVTLSEDNEGVSKRYDNITYSIDTASTRAVLIGAGEFTNDFHPIPPVTNNIEDFYKLLIDKRNIGLAPENISIALNKTNTEIEELLLRVSKLADTETLIIYFSGHGYRSDVSKLHLIASNTRKIDDYISGGVDYDFIKNIILKSSPAKQKIVILDACHSGIATQGASDAILDVNVSGTYIMASSESDEVSYYDINKRNTFFTGSLLDTFTKGIDNAKEMLSLNDLYENAIAHLDQRQQPRFKDKLNISPADFYIARNPAFSLEKNIQHARQLFKAGNLSEAFKESRKILQRQPGNQEVKDMAEQCNTDLLMAQFMKQGDEYFYHKHEYQKALDYYLQAYEIKPDFIITGKIRDCKALLHEEKNVEPAELNSTAGKQVHPATDRVKKEPEAKGSEKDHGASEKKWIAPKLLVFIIAALVTLLGWWLLTFIKGHGATTNFAQLAGMLDSLPEQALPLLREAKEKDSAYYIIGNYYRADKKPDSAVFYYDKAIASSHLPAAYSALAAVYYNYEITDSTNIRSSYEILKTADSLFKADTSAYFMLGSIVERKAILARIGNMANDTGNELIKETERWYQKGFKKGSKQCRDRLGFFYLDALQNPSGAYPYLKVSAENGNHIAQLYMSDMLGHGNGTAKNTEEGNKWFRLYADNADPNALVQTAKIYAGTGSSYYRGYVMEPDCSKAATLVAAAESKAGTIPAQDERSNLFLELGNFYYGKNATCKNFIKTDHAKARGYYQKAMELGNGIAGMYLADSTLVQ